MHATARRLNRGQTKGAGTEFRMEAVEKRVHASVSSWTSTSISDIFGNANAYVLFGDNGDPWGTATGVAGLGYSEDAVQYVIWDGDYSNGIDSGSRSYAFGVNKQNNGQGSITVGNDTETLSVGTSGAFSTVTIRAAVMGAGMSMSLTGISVKFYQNGQQMQSFSGYSVVADRLNSNQNSPFESGLTITATGGPYNGVEVTASVQMQAAQGVYPGATDIFANVAVS